MKNTSKTMPLIFGILIIASVSVFQIGPLAILNADAEPPKRVVGYFSLWQDEDLDLIDYTNLTEIIYFHIWPHTDGSLITWDISTLDLNKIRDRAHAMGVRILISVGGAGASDGFPIMAEDPVARANFISNISDFILTYDLDGVDINWETEINQAKIDNQDILLSELVRELHPLGKTVTVTVHGDIMDLKANNSIDWVNVMAYDLNGQSAEHSTFSDSVSALQMYENIGIPKDKLVLGIPFYGRSDGWSSAMNYQEIMSACNPQPIENYCKGHYFNGIDLVQQKAQYVLDNGYEGVMVWDLGKDTHDDTSLLSAINEILDSAPHAPKRPIKLESKPISSNIIFLSWQQAESKENVTGYKIEIKEGSKDWKVVVQNTESNENSFYHRELNGNNSYKYRIYAINSEGVSEASSTILEDSLAPITLDAEIISTTQINLSWSPPSFTFGKSLTGYSIERESSSGDYHEIKTVGPDVTSNTLNSLQTGKEYTFAVKPLFDGESGSSSLPLSIKTNEKFDGVPIRCIIPNFNYEFIWIECFT